MDLSQRRDDQRHHRQHHLLDHLHNGPVSRLAPFAALILTVTLIGFFFVRYYVFELYLLDSCYGNKYRCLNDKNRRGFVNHHIAGIAKIVMALAGFYPFIAVISGKARMHDHLAGSGIVTFGDSKLKCPKFLNCLCHELTTLSPYSAESVLRCYVHLRARLPCRAFICRRCAPRRSHNHRPNCGRSHYQLGARARRRL